MKLEEMTKIFTKHGQFTAMSYKTELKLKKNNPFGRVIQNTDVHGIQIGANYDNKKDVKEARANGVLPTENQGLNGVEWVIFPYILQNPKTKSYQMRYYTTPNTKYNTVYTDENGKEININELKPFMYAKSTSPSVDNTRNIIIDKIVKIK